MVGYVVNCSVNSGENESSITVNGTVKGSGVRTFSFSVKSGKVSCLVAATNEQHLMGRPSEAVSIDSSGKTL